MTNRKNYPRRRKTPHQRRVIVRGIRRSEIDTKKLARALLALVEAQAEAAAQAEHEARQENDRD